MRLLDTPAILRWPRLAALRWAAMALCLMLLAACAPQGGGGDGGGSTGEIAITVIWPGAQAGQASGLQAGPLTAPPTVAYMRATVTVGDFVATQTASATAGSDSMGSVPVGTATVLLEALDGANGNVLYSGNTTVTVVADKSVGATVTMVAQPGVAGWISWYSISAGGAHSLALRTDGVVFAWGSSQSGQVGDNNSSFHNVSAPVSIISGMASISAGGSHSLAIAKPAISQFSTIANTYSWGSDYDGQLGISNNTYPGYPGPVAIGHLDIGGAQGCWSRVSAGGSHSLGITCGGGLDAWGLGYYGQLGISVIPDLCGLTGSDPCAISPRGVGPLGVYWAEAAAGGSHSLGRRTDGTLYSWGRNAEGQLGLGTTISQSTPVNVPVPGGTGTWNGISAGGFHSLGLRSDDTLWIWGQNTSGQLGIGASSPDTCSTNACAKSPQQVALPGGSPAGSHWSAAEAGDLHTLALRSDGTLWAWGDNTTGQLGIGASSPDTCGSNPCAKSPQQVPLPSGSPAGSTWIAVSAGGIHSMAIRSDGTLWTWGANGYGQLGIGVTSPDTCGSSACAKTPQPVPVPTQ